MRFTKALAALGTAGIAAALLLGGTTAANADDSTASSTIRGTAVIYGGGATDYHGIIAPTAAGEIAKTYRTSSAADASTRAATLEIPAKNETGSIRHASTDLCLSATASAQPTWQKCDPASDSQQFTTGQFTNRYVTGWGLQSVATKGWVQGSSVIDMLVGTVDNADRIEGIDNFVGVIADLTVTVTSVDADAKSAVLTGTGEPGTELTITGPAGDQTVTVEDDGTWTATVTGLAEGDNDIKVSQTVGTDTQTVDLVATLLPSPIVAPVIAAGAGVLALGALGTTLLVRRRHNA